MCVFSISLQACWGNKTPARGIGIDFQYIITLLFIIRRQGITFLLRKMGSKSYFWCIFCIVQMERLNTHSLNNIPGYNQYEHTGTCTEAQFLNRGVMPAKHLCRRLDCQMKIQVKKILPHLWSSLWTKPHLFHTYICFEDKRGWKNEIRFQAIARANSRCCYHGFRFGIWRFLGIGE